MKNRPLILVFLLTLAVAIAGCGCTKSTPAESTRANNKDVSQNKYNEGMPKIDHCWFQQVLLREAAEDLSKSSGYKINLSDDVNKIDNLAVDSPNLTGLRLDEILDRTLEYLNKNYHLRLYWEISGTREIIIRQMPVLSTKPVQPIG